MICRCGKEFEPSKHGGSPQQWCNPACRAEHLRKPPPESMPCARCSRSFVPIATNLGRQRFCSAKCRNPKTPRAVKLGTCEHCCQTFKPRPSGTSRRFCSKACRDAGYRLRRRRLRPSSALCAECGEAFVPRAAGGRPQIWCSKKCRYQSKNAAKRAKTCPVCEKKFEPLRRQRKTCSDACARERKLEQKRLVYRSNNPRRKEIVAQNSECRRRRRLNPKSIEERHCVICKVLFVRKQWQQLACSARCSAEHRRVHNKHWQRERASSLRTRKAELRKQQRRAAEAGIIPRECLWCGDDFDAIEGEQYCSDDCQCEDAMERHANN